mgnify:CR=1 FL=1
MAGEMDGRAEPAGHGQRIDPDGLGAAPRFHRDRGDRLAAAGGDHPCIAHHPCLAAVEIRRGRPRVDDRRHAHARRLQVVCQTIGVVRGGEDRPRGAGRHPVARQIASHPAGQHDAGPVVAAEDQRALVCAGGQHRALGDDAPQALGRARLACAMRRGTLHGAEDIVVVPSEHGGARHGADVGQAVQFRQQCGEDPRVRVAGVGAKQRAARLGLLVGQDDACAGPARRKGGGESRRPRADHQQVAMRPALLVARRVRLVAGPAEARRPADQRLVELLPEFRRPHEGLVVEAGAQERREQPVCRAEIEFERRPAVLARRVQPVMKLHDGGARVRRGAAVAPQGDQRVGLGRSGAQDAARAVVLEAAADQHAAVGQQRRSQRVALEAGHRPAVEAERQRRRTVDRAALVETERGHRACSAPRACPVL